MIAWVLFPVFYQSGRAELVDLVKDIHRERLHLFWSSPVFVDTFGNKGDDSYMARKRYTEEYKKHLLDLVREGRSPEQLAQEYEPSARTIRNWMREDEVKRRSKETDKDHELRRLKAENTRLREERDILKKAAAWFAVESVSTPKKGTRS